MTSSPSVPDTPPCPPLSSCSDTPQHDHSPFTPPSSPLLPSPTTPCLTASPRLSTIQKGKWRTKTLHDSPHPFLQEDTSHSVPRLIDSSPTHRSNHCIALAAPPDIYGPSVAPPSSPTSSMKEAPCPSTPRKRVPTSGALLCQVTSSSYSPPPTSLSPPSSVLPVGFRQDKLDFYPLPTRGVQVNPPDDVSKSETVLRAAPIHGVLHSSLLYTHCSGCFLSPEHVAKRRGMSLNAARKTFLDCSRCHILKFCSMVGILRRNMS